MRTQYWLAGVTVALAAGCAQTGNVADSPGGAKTLLEWRTAEKEGGADAEPADEPEEDVIATDRPDFTEASSTVGLGRIQIESGYTYTRDRDTNVTSHSYPEVLLRVGLFADWFELRVGQNVATTRTRTAGVTDDVTGAEDLYLGTKLFLTEQKGWGPEVSLMFQATVPTGKSEYTADRTLPGVSLLYGWDVTDFISVAGSTQGNAAVDGIDGRYFELAQSFTVGYSFTDKLGGYTEVFGFMPHGAATRDTVPLWYANGGLTYKLTPNLQYDVRVGAGLNDAADDFFAGAGFAYRY